MCCKSALKIQTTCKIIRICMGFSDSSAGKESTCNAGDPSSIAGLGRSPEEGIGYPLQYSWASLVAQLVKNLLQCGRPGLDPWVGKILWRRAWQPPRILQYSCLEDPHGQRSLLRDNPWGCKESDTTERLSTQQESLRILTLLCLHPYSLPCWLIIYSILNFICCLLFAI